MTTLPTVAGLVFALTLRFFVGSVARFNVALLLRV
jgi:hypothetical protein